MADRPESLGEDRVEQPHALGAAAARWWEHNELVVDRWHGIFKGGGAKGIAYAGALQAVADHGRWFRSAAGSSAGAITATLIAAGLMPDQIEAQTPLLLECVKRNWLGLAMGGATPIYSMMGVQLQLRTVLRDQLRTLGADKTDPTVTFEALWNVTHIDLYVVGMDLATSHPIVFNHVTTPECDIPLAVAASCAIPVAFDSGRLATLNPLSPRGFDVHRIVDGGAWANYPAFVFKDHSFRAYSGLPRIPDNEPIVGFVLDRGDTADVSVPWTFRPELETDETHDLGIYVRSRRVRAVLKRLDTTRWRLFTFVFWPLAMLAITANSLVGNEFGRWRWLESALSGWVSRSVLVTTFAIAGAILIGLALTFFALGREIIRSGIGTVIAAMSVATDVPPWLGTATGDHVVRVPVPRTLGTTRFHISEKERREIIQAARQRSQEQLQRIIDGKHSLGGLKTRSTDLPKPDDVALRPKTHLVASRYALGNAMLLLTFAAIGLVGGLLNHLVAGLPVNWGSFVGVFLVLLLPAVAAVWSYRRSAAEREAIRRKEQLTALEHPPGEPLTVAAQQLLTFQKIRSRIRRRAFAACLFAAVAVWYTVSSVQHLSPSTGAATVVEREEITSRTFIYEVIIEEGEGSGERWRFDSHQRLNVGDRVQLRYVGGNQQLEVASDAPGGTGAVILVMTYLVGMNLLGIRWALADRAWLEANPEMQSETDRKQGRRSRPNSGPNRRPD